MFWSRLAQKKKRERAQSTAQPVDASVEPVDQVMKMVLEVPVGFLLVLLLMGSLNEEKGILVFIFN